VLLALTANAVWFAGYSRASIPVTERRVAPFLAVCACAMVGLAAACVWLYYAWGVQRGVLSS
jgi:hypothetical protein